MCKAYPQKCKAIEEFCKKNSRKCEDFMDHYDEAKELCKEHPRKCKEVKKHVAKELKKHLGVDIEKHVRKVNAKKLAQKSASKRKWGRGKKGKKPAKKSKKSKKAHKKSAKKGKWGKKLAQKSANKADKDWLKKHSTKKCKAKCINRHVKAYNKEPKEMKDALKSLIMHGRTEIGEWKKKEFKTKDWNKVWKLKKEVDDCMKNKNCWEGELKKLDDGKKCLKNKHCNRVVNHMMKDAWIRHSLQRCWWSKDTCVMGY